MLPGIKLLVISCPKRSINDYARNKDEELWVANINASNPRRITVDEGIESMPSFSPDGKRIAFSAQHDGNTDVFIVPVAPHN